MDQKEINKQIFKRIEKIEKAVFAKGINPIGTKKNLKLGVKTSLPNLILKLRDDRFFSQPKSVSEVHKKLQPIYPCDFNRVEVALLRLYKKRQLRKTSKMVGSKKIIAYVW